MQKIIFLNLKIGSYCFFVAPNNKLEGKQKYEGYGRHGKSHMY